MKSQSEAMMAMVDQQKLDCKLDRQQQKEEQRLLKIERNEERAEQRRVNDLTDAKFLQMLQAFTTQTTQGILPSPIPPPSTIVISPTVAAPPTQTTRPSTPPLPITQPMDTAPDATNATDPEQRPMDEYEAPALPFRFPQPDFQESQFHFDEAAIALEQQQLAEMHAENDSVATNSSNKSLETPSQLQATDNATEKPDDGDEADDEEESDDDKDDDADDDESDDDEDNDAYDDESERPKVFDAEDDSHTAMAPRVLYHNDEPTAGGT